MLRALALAPLALALVAASDPAPPPAPPAPAPLAPPPAAPAPPAPPAPAPLAPLSPSSWLEALPGGAGYVAPPFGAREERAVVVAVHGNGDRPDWACSEWRAVFGPRPFIVCPRGAPLDAAGSAFVWRTADEITRAVARAIDGAQTMYPGYLAPPPRVYAGFSRGAILGARVVEADPATYPYAIFLEGFGDVGPRFARAFAAGGGKRVLLGCSQAGCEAPRRPLVAALENAGIAAKIAYAGNQGHTVNAAVVAAVQKELPWLLAGDARFTP